MNRLQKNEYPGQLDRLRGLIAQHGPWSLAAALTAVLVWHRRPTVDVHLMDHLRDAEDIPERSREETEFTQPQGFGSPIFRL